MKPKVLEKYSQELASPSRGMKSTVWLLITLLVFSWVVLPPRTEFAGKKSKPPAAPSAPRVENLVWPQPPQRPRIRFVRQILSIDDVLERKKKQGWMDRLAGVKQGQDRIELRKPYGVAVDSQGKIYVADSANRVVFVFDLTAKSMETRGQKGQARLALPIGVAVDDHDRLFVSDSYNHKINCYSPEGELLAVVGSDQLQRPAGIAIDNQRRRLYVADAKAHRLAVFDIDAYSFQRFIGEPSAKGEAEAGKFSAPTNIALDQQGHLFVTDTWNYRIQVFEPDGKFVRAFGEQGVLPGNFVRPKGITIDGEGHVYVADAEFNNFQILTPEGQALMAVGALGSEPGQFALIAGMAIDKKNRIYVTDQLRGRLQIFEYIPEKAAISGEGPKPQ